WRGMWRVGEWVCTGGERAVMHETNPAKYGPAGGLGNLTNAAYILSALGAVAAVLVGATMGAGDVQAGGFRDLVATGRSRLALFTARIPGGLALLWPLVAVSWAAACTGSVLLAGSSPRPGVTVMVEGGLWVLLATGVSYLMALGLASLAGSRSAIVGILVAWQFAVPTLVLGVTKLGVLREGLLTAGLGPVIAPGVAPGGGPDPGSPPKCALPAAALI